MGTRIAEARKGDLSATDDPDGSHLMSYVLILLRNPLNMIKIELRSIKL